MSSPLEATRFINAAKFEGKEAIGLEERPVEAPEAAEVTVSVAACGICGTDLHFYSGRWPQPPFTPGHEFAGVISALGPGVEEWQMGERVCIEPVLPCGACRFCRRGETNLCQDFRFLSIHRNGGLASEVVTPVSCLHRMPEGMPDSLGALVEPLAVAVHACRVGNVQSGDIVVICGMGSIGLLSLVAARDSGASTILCSARHPHQKEAARRLGGVAVAPEDLEAAVKEATGGTGADVVIETVGGAGQTVGQSLSSVRSGGAVVLVGGFTRPASVHLWRVVSREIRLLGANCYSRAQSPTDFELALRIAASNRYPLANLITHHLPLSDVASAFRTALDKTSGAIKVQLIAGRMVDDQMSH